MFTGLRTARKALERAEELSNQVMGYGAKWNAALAECRRRVETAEADLEKLRTQHLKLRGTFHAFANSRSAIPAGDPAAGEGSRDQRKAAALARFRVMQPLKANDQEQD
jgi:hypothetical protein